MRRRKKISARKRLHRAYLKSDHWKALRALAIERDGRKCLRCGCEKYLNVHHKVYRDPLELGTVDDLETLCRFCHEDEHGLGPTPAQIKFENRVYADCEASQILNSAFRWDWRMETIPYEIRRGIALLARRNKHLVGMQKCVRWWLPECALYARNV